MRNSPHRTIVQASGCRTGRSGFSLIEVCLAMIIVGSGILLLFGLFPAGLREAEYSVGDTHIGFFVDYVLSGLHANADNITEWDDWDNMSDFRSLVIGSLADPVNGEIRVTPSGDPKDVANDLEFPAGSGNKIRYMLNIERVSGHPNLRYAELNVSAGEHGWMGMWFRTEFFYSGMK